jgi:cytochrome oxidase assembly protein ShyY1
MATVLAGPRIGEHVACQRGQSKCVVKFAIAQLITNKPVTLTGYLRFPVAAGLFRSNVEHAKRLWFTRDHLAMAQALGWDRVASFYIDLEARAASDASARRSHAICDYLVFVGRLAADRVCRLAARP